VKGLDLFFLRLDEAEHWPNGSLNGDKARDRQHTARRLRCLHSYVAYLPSLYHTPCISWLSRRWFPFLAIAGATAFLRPAALPNTNAVGASALTISSHI